MSHAANDGPAPARPVLITLVDDIGEPAEISLDEYGVLRYQDRWVALPKAERTAMATLLRSFGRVASRDALNRAVWPDREPDPARRQIHVLVFRLRKRIAPIGLSISTIRSHGFLLHWQEAAHG